MNRSFCLLASLFLAVTLLACTPGEKEQVSAPAAPAAPASSGELQTDDQKLSYAFGLEVGASLKQVPAAIDIDFFSRGVADSLGGKTPLLSEEEAAAVRQNFVVKMQEQQEQQLKETAERNLREGEAFLQENLTREGVTATPSGLQYEVMQQGDGPVPQPEDIVTVHYRGTLIDGTEFDSSYNGGEPIALPLANMIEGWSEALQLMPVGSKYKLFLPAALAFGERGAGPVIGPNTALVFEVELLGIEEAPAVEELPAAETPAETETETAAEPATPAAPETPAAPTTAD